MDVIAPEFLNKKKRIIQFIVSFNLEYHKILPDSRMIRFAVWHKALAIWVDFVLEFLIVCDSSCSVAITKKVYFIMVFRQFLTLEAFEYLQTLNLYTNI